MNPQMLILGAAENNTNSGLFVNSIFHNIAMIIFKFLCILQYESASINNNYEHKASLWLKHISNLPYAVILLKFLHNLRHTTTQNTFTDNVKDSAGWLDAILLFIESWKS